MGKREIVTTEWVCDECGAEKKQTYQPSDWRLIGLQRFKSTPVVDSLLCASCLGKLQSAIPNLIGRE